MAITTRNCGLRVCLTLMLFSKLTQTSQLSPSKCPIIHTQWNQLTETNLPHLCKMSGPSLPQCLSEIQDFRFPLDVLKVIQSDNVNVVYRILQQIFYFLSKENPYEAWNSTCTENLQNTLHQQIKEVETCLGARETQKRPVIFGDVASYSSTLKVKRYFQRMNSFLNENQHSQCAWEVIYSEITGCFLFITQILKMLT
ncbi:interferon alpha-11-like [Sceloporus undulatus]|uniref:interferon alpha-11-like n=1 Tax=Sceloporus undulatus TaxID=8520 RepID=UPI001C4DD0DF|nr:interferon alpha-11-like [Sceloporus undulatus]